MKALAAVLLCASTAVCFCASLSLICSLVLHTKMMRKILKQILEKKKKSMFSCAPTQCAVPHDGRESLIVHLQTDFSVEVMVITDVVRGLVRIRRIFQESLQI